LEYLIEEQKKDGSRNAVIFAILRFQLKIHYLKNRHLRHVRRRPGKYHVIEHAGISSSASQAQGHEIIAPSIIPYRVDVQKQPIGPGRSLFGCLEEPIRRGSICRIRPGRQRRKRYRFGRLSD
jgi:hypothetical protein